MSDTKFNLICPACGNSMEKINLPEHGFSVDICTNGCGGIFLDNREIKKIDEYHEDITPITKALEGKDFKSVDRTKIRQCPVCKTKMVKNFSSCLKNIQIDECYNCGGVFLDEGELVGIRSEFKTEEERKEAFRKFAREELGTNFLEQNSAPKKERNSLLQKIIRNILK